MSHRIRLKTNWTGIVDGKEAKVTAGKTVDVDTVTAHALVWERQIAELIPIEEIIEKVKLNRKPGRPGKKVIETPPADKMIRTAKVAK